MHSLPSKTDAQDFLQQCAQLASIKNLGRILAYKTKTEYILRQFIQSSSEEQLPRYARHGFLIYGKDTSCTSGCLLNLFVRKGIVTPAAARFS